MVDNQSLESGDDAHDKSYEQNLALLAQVWAKVEEAEQDIQAGFKGACSQMAKYVDELTAEMDKYHDAQNKSLEQIVARIRGENERMKLKKIQKIKDMHDKLMGECEQRKRVKLGELGKQIEVAKKKQDEIVEFVKKNIS